jgi:rhomboid protease GluP
MEPNEVGMARTIEVRFTPPLDLLGPPRAARRNVFGLRGTGAIVVRASELVLSGKRPRPFWFAARVDISIPRDGISNVARDGTKVEFAYRLADGSVGKTAVWARDDVGAEEIVAALPDTQTARFKTSQVQLTAFNAQLVAVSPSAWVTPTLIVVNVLAFAWTTWRGGGLFEPNGLAMIGLGSDYGPLTTSGEWWRALTSMFLHFGVLHVALNMWALSGTGQLVERLYGSGYFLLLYLLAGLCGSIASVAWNPGVNSAGASGAIFGVFGALLAFVVNKKGGVPASIVQEHRASTLVFIGYNLLNGFAHAGIDNAAHMGGLIGGFLIGWLLVRPVTVEERQTSNAIQVGAALAVGVAALAAGIFSLQARSPDFTAEQRFRAAMLDYSVEETLYVRALKERPLGGSDAEIAKRIDSELLPISDRMSSAISSVPALPERSRLHAFQSLLTEYVDSRGEAFRKLVEANATHDPRTTREAQRLAKQSEQALAKLQTLPDRP